MATTLYNLEQALSNAKAMLASYERDVRRLRDIMNRKKFKERGRESQLKYRRRLAKAEARVYQQAGKIDQIQTQVDGFRARADNA